MSHKQTAFNENYRPINAGVFIPSAEMADKIAARDQELAKSEAERLQNEQEHILGTQEAVVDYAEQNGLDIDRATLSYEQSALSEISRIRGLIRAGKATDRDRQHLRLVQETVGDARRLAESSASVVAERNGARHIRRAVDNAERDGIDLTDDQLSHLKGVAKWIRSSRQDRLTRGL